MRCGRWITLCAVVFAGIAQVRAQTAQPEAKTIVLIARTVYDGRGKTLHNTTLIIRGSKIVQLGGKIPPGAVVYNLRGLTITPGFIDTHSHILWHFTDGRLAGRNEQPLQSMLHSVDNAVLTLNAGFTTIQSPGSPDDAYLRDAIKEGSCLGLVY